MPRQRVEVGERMTCPCGAEVGAGSRYCSDECELDHLRQQVKEKDERLRRLSRKKGPPACLGRVNWLTCLQEWYLKDSYDAKRRATQLRKLGFTAQATSIGEIPIRGSDGLLVMKRITVLTAWHPDQAQIAPAPQFIEGLRTRNGGR